MKQDDQVTSQAVTEPVLKKPSRKAKSVSAASARAGANQPNSQTVEQRSRSTAVPSRVYDTIIIGAGISGLAAAYKLNQAGYQDYLVLEKAGRVGGTWRDNTYPGCGCDVPSALYSFSFAPSHGWSHLFAKQPEILHYLEDVATRFQLYAKIEFHNELQDARWNHAYDLRGKRIAVIGTGASAIQFIPKIQPLAKELYIFQRTAPWVLPKPDLPLNQVMKSTLAKFPVIQQRWRGAVSQSLNLINFGLRHPPLLEPVNVLSRQLLKLQVKDPALRQAVTPNFSVGCKRLLFANDYYPALQAPNSTLIPHGLVEIEGNTVISANGDRHEVDVIIWGTGFEVSHPPIGRRVQNAQGQRLSELWQSSSPEAFLGTSIQHLPNAFLVLGPNILVYDSFIGIAEAQLDYIVSGLLQMKVKGLKRIEIKPDVLKYHNAKVQTHVQKTVFNRGGCQSYYLDQNGRNFAAWPWSLAELKRCLQRLDLEHYQVA
ncbi:flavin-containing monooxygenase [Acinetobacter indicus]|uniref:flavin-containing monooxygenase n=1 Tax=Acinetobacter indicus TaxID=756892 RepID=UPI000CEBAEC9|nr:NAD(P)/FAD-dependent oxidoreductase [Acinetobacter indicus]